MLEEVQASFLTRKLEHETVHPTKKPMSYASYQRIISLLKTLNIRLCNESCGYTAICHKNNFTHTIRYRAENFSK